MTTKGVKNMNKAKWQEWNDGWFNYHYCTNCGFKHFNPNEKVLPTYCPNCHKQLKHNRMKGGHNGKN